MQDATRFYRRGDRRGRLHVVGGGVERVAGDYRIERSRFPHHGIELVVAGRGSLVLGRRSARLVPGVLFVYGTRTPHRIATDPRERLVKYFADFDGADAAVLLRRAALPAGSVMQTSATSELVSLFDELIRSGQRPGTAASEVCSLLLRAIVLKAADTRIALGSAQSQSFATYQRCRDVLERDALELRSLQDLAERCAIDPAYLCRLFQRFAKASPYQLLLRRRIHHAATLLQSRRLLIKEVAAELGFADPYHFSRSFKAVMGLSPQRFVQEQSL